MKNIFIVALLSLSLLPCCATELIVKTDAACQLTVDSKAKRILTPNKTLRLKIAAGAHRIEAVPSVGGASWQKTIDIAEAKQPQELSISFGPTLGFWIDPATKRMWTAADSGSGLSWGQAQRYCRELTLAGFRDWTLPAIDDLQQISSSTANESGFRTTGPLKLTGWQWSSTPGTQPGEGWAFDFGDGGRASVAAGDSGLNRALCVRQSRN